MTTTGDTGRSETIRLSDGWTARVRTGALASIGAMPNPEVWRAFLAQLVASPQSLPGYAVLKSTRGSEVFRATLADGERSIEVVAKQSHLHNMRRRLSAMTQGTREGRNFRKSLRFQAAGFDTAQPLAVMERRRPRREAWLITEFLADVVGLDHIAHELIAPLDSRARLRVKKNLIAAIAGLLVKLERESLTHRDFKASNLLIRHWNCDRERPTVCMVDLDGIHRARIQSAGTRWRPVIRLVASLLDCPGVNRTDLARLLRSYLTGRGEPPGIWRSHFHRIAGASAIYLQRSEQRKAKRAVGR